MLRHEGYEVRLNSDDHEPPHVHVWKAGGQVKIWLDPLALGERQGMSVREASRARELVWRHRSQLVARWEEIHGHAAR